MKLTERKKLSNPRKQKKQRKVKLKKGVNKNQATHSLLGRDHPFLKYP